MDNSFKQKVLQSTDIVEVIGEHVSLTRRGKEFVGLCPFHPDHKPSLLVNPKKQIFKCFACGAGGDVLKFVQLRERLDYRDAVALLATRAGISLATSAAERQADLMRDQVRKAVEWARSHFRNNLQTAEGGRAALDYARGRGLTPETIDRHGLGYAPDAWDHLLRAAARAGISNEVLQQAGLITTGESGRTYDRFRNRLIFPISDALGRPVAFGGRTLADDPAKYLNSPETPLFSKSRVLYALDLARRSIEERGEAVVVEGYLDAVLLHQFGFTNAVATLGTALTDAHITLLKRLSDRIVLCFDGDHAGVRAADRALEVSVLGGTDVRVVVLEPNMDPADCVVSRGAAGFQDALRSAVDALDFKWTMTCAASANKGPQARRVAMEALLDFIATVLASGRAGPLEQHLLVRRLSELLSMPAEQVYPLLAAAQRRTRPATGAERPGPAETSSYLASLRDVPAGLVAAVEDLFGLLLTDPNCATCVDDRFREALGACAAWQRLYAVIQGLSVPAGSYTRADVIARCDDAEVCELVGRACAHAAGTSATREAFQAAQDRLASELDAQRMGDLQRELRRSSADPSAGDEEFSRLREKARRQNFALAAEKRWNAEPTE